MYVCYCHQVVLLHYCQVWEVIQRLTYYIDWGLTLHILQRLFSLHLIVITSIVGLFASPDIDAVHLYKSQHRIFRKLDFQTISRSQSFSFNLSFDFVDHGFHSLIAVDKLQLCINNKGHCMIVYFQILPMWIMQIQLWTTPEKFKFPEEKH